MTRVPIVTPRFDRSILIYPKMPSNKLSSKTCYCIDTALGLTNNGMRDAYLPGSFICLFVCFVKIAI